MPQYLVTLSYSLHFCCNSRPTPESNWGFLKKHFYIFIYCVYVYISATICLWNSQDNWGSQCSLITCELQESNLGPQIWKKHPCLQGNLAHPCTIAFFAETVYVIEFCEYLQMIRIFSFFLGSIFSLNHLYFMCFRSLYNIDFIIN